MSKRILVTGGCGFIGHHFVEHLIKNTDWDIVVLDRLNYASSGFDRVKDINVYDDKRVTILTADFTNPINEGLAKEIGQLDYIVHMGAETHVDNSINNPEPFVMSNVVGTMRMLDFAKEQNNLQKFIMFSTDEVYGPAPQGVAYKEIDRYNSTNPYSGSKASSEQLAMAYANCYNLPIIVTNTMNVFGERQHPEKFIPMTIKKVLNDETVLIHSSPDKKVSGSRYWIHARNVADALLFLLEHCDMSQKYFIDDKGLPQFNHRYNIVGEREVSNLDMAKYISEVLGKELKYEMINFHESRPGHDLRYALDGSKIKKFGWELPKSFEDSLKKTIEWSLENKRWLE